MTEPRRVPPTPEDWRILRALSLYRLMLVILLLVMFETGYAPLLFEQLRGQLFKTVCTLYALVALLLVLMVSLRKPAAAVQAPIHFACDLIAITLLVSASGGVQGGLGILLITPAVGCALLLTPRMAAVQAAAATLAMFGVEMLRQTGLESGVPEFTATGVLGLMFFGTTLGASVVAARARRSEQIAAQVGSEFANLSRLNESIIESMQTGVLVVDGERRVRSSNAAAARLLGGRSAAGRLLMQEAPQLEQALQDWLAGAPPPDEPLVLGAGAPEVLPRFTRLGWGSSAPLLILLDDAARLREQAQQIKLAALGRLSASIAHEIRNPLSAITHAGQLLAEAPEIGGENQRLLAMIQRHSARIEKIIRDMLMLSRREPGERARLPLKSWLLKTVALYQEGFPQAPRPLEMLEISENLHVRFDPSHLQQVLFNLWDNSFEHGGPGITVTIGAESAADGGTVLEVRDNGPGIPTALLERVFEPFFTTAAKGTGLGLYLSRELCEYNQARLLYAARGHGACFRILFAAEPR